MKNAALQSKWVRQLEDAQLPDGSWGRFHSQDTKKKTVFRTTEEAIDRAFALGLEPGDGLLTRVSQYIQNVLDGDAQITDRDEKNEAWPLLVKFILAGRLAQIDPANQLLDPFWTYSGWRLPDKPLPPGITAWKMKQMHIYIFRGSMYRVDSWKASMRCGSFLPEAALPA